MVAKKILAVDLGASSGRVMQGLFDGEKVELTEIHRFSNNAISIRGNLYWDSLNLFQEIKNGIVKSSLDDIPIESIAIDTWGVDYCYLDNNGDIIFNPYSHRDPRTKVHEDEFYSQISGENLFRKTGIQPSLINSVNQIHADIAERPYLLKIVDKILFMPDLLTYLLSGKKVNEHTILSTSGLMDVDSRELSEEVVEKLGIPFDWFPEISRKGQVLGTLTAELRDELNVNDFKVIAGAGHDTASAVLAIPYVKDIHETAFISSGTWSLVGVESEEPITSKKAFDYGLTNEGRFDGNYRVLKNTTGLWLYNELRNDWQLKGEDDVSHQKLMSLADETTDNQIYIDPNHPSFSSPGNMENKIQQFCADTNQDIPQTKGHIMKVVFESLAMSYRNTIEQLEEVTDQNIEQIQMLGGGIQNEMLCQITADFTERELYAGPIEASSLGNIAAQLISLKLINDRAEIVNLIKNSSDLSVYKPDENLSIEEKYKNFKNILVKEDD